MSARKTTAKGSAQATAKTNGQAVAKDATQALSKEDMLRQRVERGEEAKALADHPLLLDALEACKERVEGQFRAADSPDSAWLAKVSYNAVEDFIRQLRGQILAGRDAMAVLNAEDDAVGAKSYEADIGEYLARAREARAAFDSTQPENGESK